MERDDALTLIRQKDWNNLLKELKNNQVFDSLIKDEIFKELFKKYFIDELLNDIENTNQDKILELSAIFNFHKSDSYKFSLQKNEYQKLVLKLVEITGDYIYAKEYPENPVCRKIILNYEKDEEEKSKFIKDNYELKKNLNIIEIDSKQICLDNSIFNSPQEIEFYNAARQVFQEEILLPNAALSTVLDDEILNKLEKQERWLFLTTTVDFVIVENQTYMPIYFFELDSKHHDSPNQIIKDKIKDKLISEAGYKLFRVRKNISGDKSKYFLKWLRKIKNGG